MLDLSFSESSVIFFMNSCFASPHVFPVTVVAVSCTGEGSQDVCPSGQCVFPGWRGLRVALLKHTLNFLRGC